MKLLLKRVLKKVLNFAGIQYKYGRFHIKNNTSPDKIKYHKELLGLIEGNDLIECKLKTDNPLLIARIGASELLVILNYLNFKHRAKVVWSDYLRDEIWRQSGVFPVDDQTLTKFAKEYLEAIKEVDVMGVWNNEGENEVIRISCPDASLIPLESIEPYFFDQPWSRCLSNKTVLVIHPFEDSIRYQYEQNRQKIFSNQDILPSFNLITLKAFQTQVYNESSFASWFEVLESMKVEIASLEFDIAIIGAGAYGLPLGAYIKKLGKQAVHMGGATQILFGIKGKRWEERDSFKKMFNPYWKYPYPFEKPEKANSLEGGAYW